ncbi:hypothetical protein [Paraflavitalea speifideaquila]|uniref:hypothetical protein n=1 Tax=Paraflavitalea speifideaquila TaxID=3076558 RepID=UPI0028E51377|nr:hypothetical protein [Paraflavitalea speifideiaquila]
MQIGEDRKHSLRRWEYRYADVELTIVQIEGKRIVRIDDKQRATLNKRSSFENPAVKIIRSVKF